MILKAKHFYRVEYKYQARYQDYSGYRGYILTFPKKDIYATNTIIESFAHIDVLGKYNENSSIYISNDWIFKKPSVSDVFKILQAMRKNKSKLKYNFKTNEIICE